VAALTSFGRRHFPTAANDSVDLYQRLRSSDKRNIAAADFSNLDFHDAA
jgi:hypothetical protein